MGTRRCLALARRDSTGDAQAPLAQHAARQSMRARSQRPPRRKQAAANYLRVSGAPEQVHRQATSSESRSVFNIGVQVNLVYDTILRR